MENSNNEESACCKAAERKEGNGFLAGIAYGIIPHIGCIAFLIFAVLGVTTATAFFKPLLLNPYFFYILIALSLLFASISAVIYLRRSGALSASGLKRKWKYLSVLYGTTVFVNLFLFMIVFPYATNLTSKPTITGAVTRLQSQPALTLQVSIPCPGHAPLITYELKKISGVSDVKFRFPNLFDVSYDSTKTSKQQILNLDVFGTYKAILIDESVAKNAETKEDTQVSNLKGSCGCGNSCSGGCCG